MKAKAREIINDMAQHSGWVSPHARGTDELWGPRAVRDALVDAYRLLNRISGKIGPARLAAVWPEHIRDYPPEKARTSAFTTSMTVTRMEMVLIGSNSLPKWLDLLGEVPELQSVLRQCVMAELRGEATKELCMRKGWVYTTALTHRDRAAGIIAQRLNSARVEVWR